MTKATVALVALQGAVTASTAITMHLRPLSTAACANQCVYPLMTGAVNAFFVVAILVTILSVGLMLLLRKRGAWVLVPPALAILMVATAFMVTDSLARQSIGL